MDKPASVIPAPAAEEISAVVQRPLGKWERLYDSSLFRKTVLLAVLAMAWEGYALYLNNPLLFPRFSATMRAFAEGIFGKDHVLVERAWYSITLLLQGYALGLILAALLTGFAIGTRVGNDLLETLTAMFNPLPAIALLPLALIWFGLGKGGVIFVLVHSVLWAVALNTHTGFQSVSPTLRMVGRNYGLRGGRYVMKILVPAAFPAILTGLKIGWAFAWRTLIAAELVFGVSSGSGGVGWYIFENKNQLLIENVFAGLFTVILIGLIVDNFIFKVIERRTIQRWGMQGAG